MTLNRWKILACTLTIGVGGLAVFAMPPANPKAEPTKEPAPLPDLTVKPASPPNGTDTPAPASPAKSTEIDLDIAIPPLPAKTEEPTKKPATEPVFEPITPGPAPIVPVKGEEKKSDADKLPEVVVPPVAKPTGSEPPKPGIPALDTPKPDPVKVPLPDLDPPPVKPEPTVAPPSRPAPPVATPPAPAADTLKMPLTPVSPMKGPEAKADKLKMLLRMGDGQPRFEIRNSSSTELLLKVYGERVEMQSTRDARSSLVGVTAAGHVRFIAPSIEGTCDHLTILSGTGEVLMEGNIRLKTKRGKAWNEMTAEKLVYQIGTSGLNAGGAPRSEVRPASYTQD
jgi:hypothetical protein